MTINTLPAAPLPTDDKATFDTKAYALLGALDGFVDEANATVVEVNGLLDDTTDIKAQAGVYAADALASQTAANLSALAAASSAALSITGTGAPIWVSAGTYALGDCRWSPLNLYVYRCILAHASRTADPSLDSTYWAMALPGIGGGWHLYSGTYDSNSYNVFLNSASAGTIPAVTSVGPGFGLAVPTNATSVPATFQTSDGWTIPTGFVAGTLSAIAPIVRTTAHGYWGSSSTYTPKVDSTQATGAVSGYHASFQSPVASVALSATLHVAVFAKTTAAEAYLVAYDPTTGASGAVVSVAPASILDEAYLFATSSTSFALVYRMGTTTWVARGGTVSVVTITLGAATTVSTDSGATCTPVQLLGGAVIVPSSSAMTACTFSGTAVTVGSPLASPHAGSTYGIQPASTDTALVAYPSGTSLASKVSFALLTVAGTTLSLGTAVETATAVNNPNAATPNLSMIALSATGPYVLCGPDYTTSSTGNWYVVTVSGSTITVGSLLTTTSFCPILFQKIGTFSVPIAYADRTAFPRKFRVLDATRFMVFLGTDVRVGSVSGTTLTMGASYTAAASVFGISTDVATQSHIYLLTAAIQNKVTIAGTTISTAYSLANAPNAIFSDTLTDKAVSYGGTWYSWTLQAPAVPLSASKYLAAAAAWPTLTFYGNVS